MADCEIGYVQGMNDLAAPVVETIGMETESYYAFTTFMKQMVRLANIAV